MEQYDIFVSYSRHDGAKVDPFVNHLRNKGYRIWIDQNSNYSGALFADKIVDAIRNSRLVIFFSSESSNTSKWVRRELVEADDDGKSILPIRLDTTPYDNQIRLLLAGVDYCDVSSGKNKNLATESVYKSVVALIGKRDVTDIPKANNPGNPLLEKFYKEKVVRNELKSEALVFSMICIMVWEILQSAGVIYLHVITRPMLIALDIIIGTVTAFYATHLTTSSRVIPGWYNRNLTNYGALIIAMDFVILLLVNSLFAIFGQYYLAAVIVTDVSALALTAIGLLFRNKLAGYRLLWLTAFFYAVVAAAFGSNMYQIVNFVVVFGILALFIGILKYTLKLRINGISSWMLMHGETDKNTTPQQPSAIEKFLMIIWGNLY